MTPDDAVMPDDAVTPDDAVAEGNHYRYFRWAGFLLRHPEGDPGASQILKSMQWAPAPKEAVIDITGLTEGHRPGGWCTRLSPSEASRMADNFGVALT